MEEFDFFVLYDDKDYGIKNNDSGETLCKGVGRKLNNIFIELTMAVLVGNRSRNNRHILS